MVSEELFIKFSETVYDSKPWTSAESSELVKGKLPISIYLWLQFLWKPHNETYIAFGTTFSWITVGLGLVLCHGRMPTDNAAKSTNLTLLRHFHTELYICLSNYFKCINGWLVVQNSVMKIQLYAANNSLLIKLNSWLVAKS